MQAASRRALEAVRAASTQAAADWKSTALTTLAAQLYSVALLLAGEPRLRRTLADPATEADGRAELVDRLFGAQLQPAAKAVLTAAVRERWSGSWDFTDSLEIAGDDALFAAAESDGKLDEVEDELFRVERIFSDEGELVGLLDEQSVPAERRIGLLDAVLGGKVSPFTRALLDHAVASDRKRSIVLAIDDLLTEAARRRERSLAKVLSAVPLSAQQVQTLAGKLGELYGRPITVRADVDPSLRGGLYIRVGDEVIDGTVAHRIDQLRAAFTA